MRILRNVYRRVRRLGTLAKLVATSQFEPIKAVRGGNALNKAGRLVLRGSTNGQTVKIYEAANVRHAKFIKQVIEHPHLAGIFPRVCDQQGPFIFSEWLSGVSLQQEIANSVATSSLEELVTMQNHVHQTPVIDLPPTCFDYWSDLLWPRFARFADLLRIPDLVETVRQEVGAGLSLGPLMLMHPDVTVENVLRVPGGRLCIIDNDALTTGKCLLIDACNTGYSLGTNSAEMYLRLYLKKSGYKPDSSTVSALRAFWLARLVGSYCVAGCIREAQETIKSYKMGKNILPFTFA